MCFRRMSLWKGVQSMAYFYLLQLSSPHEMISQIILALVVEATYYHICFSTLQHWWVKQHIISLFFNLTSLCLKRVLIALESWWRVAT
jgi:hypothetical protein